jgi:hypothetical protein
VSSLGFVWLTFWVCVPCWVLLFPRWHQDPWCPFWFCFFYLFSFCRKLYAKMFNMEMWSRIKGCPCGFWYPFSMFCPHAFLFCFVVSPLPSFWNQLVFNSTLMGDFGRLLGSSSLQCPKALLVHWHVVFPIFSGGMGLISLEVIALTSYMGSWALVSFKIFSQ